MKRSTVVAAAVLVVLLAATPFLPQWLMFTVTIAAAKGLVVLGLVVLMRTGLVSFGHALYYAIGAYAAALVAQRTGMHDAALMIIVGFVAATVAGAILGFLLAPYRGIFFGMLSLAVSMILYGLLVKSSALGSTDGFNVHAKTFFGWSFVGYERATYYVVTIVLSLVAAYAMHRYLSSRFGRLSTAVRDNELRVEYLGASVRNVVHLNYVLAAAWAGLGGALSALTVGHVDPDMAYWTTSGEFIFVTILSGTGSVAAPFIGAAVFEAIRTVANQYAPHVWQMMLGIAMLAIILYLPHGLWSLFRRAKA